MFSLTGGSTGVTDFRPSEKGRGTGVSWGGPGGLVGPVFDVVAGLGVGDLADPLVAIAGMGMGTGVSACDATG